MHQSKRSSRCNLAGGYRSSGAGFHDCDLVVGVSTVGVVVDGAVVVGAEPTPGAATWAASRINHAAAEFGAIMPEVALLVPTATH